MRYAGGWMRTAYESAPAPVRRVVGLVPFGWRIGATYRRTLRSIVGQEKCSRSELEQIQDERLGRILNIAIREVPYYSQYRALLGRRPRNILCRIEPITKAMIQRDPERFIRRSARPGEYYTTSTGGTTGQPLKILLDRAGFQEEWAFMVAQWRRAGFLPGMRKATLRGVPLGGGRTYRYNPVYDELLLSPFSMSHEHLQRYVSLIQAFSPVAIHGYPSAMTVLGKYLRLSGQSLNSVRILLCGSEGLRSGQREYLEDAFACRVFSWYGMSEKVLLAGECESSTDYHAFPQYGLLEVLDDVGKVHSEPPAQGELVGTGFLNTVMPFIRYRLGDRGEWVSSRCPACGRIASILRNVRGRWTQEMIVGASGALVSLTALNMHGDAFAAVRQFQFHQSAVGAATLRIIPTESFSAGDLRNIERSLRERTGDDVSWSVDVVGAIDLSPRGKGVFLVQDLPDSVVNQ